MSTKPTAVQRYAIKFDAEAPGTEPTDADIKRVLAGCALATPHRLLETIRREVRAMRSKRVDARRLDDELRREAARNPPGADDRLAVGERVGVTRVLGDGPCAGVVLGLAHQVYRGRTSHPGWTVELDIPLAHYRQVISVPDEVVSQEAHA